MLLTRVVSTCSPSSYFFPWFFNVHEIPVSSSSFGRSFLKATSKLGTKESAFCLEKKYLTLSTGVLESNWASAAETSPGDWEDPDDGSDSDYGKEADEVEENNLDYESDPEQETDAAAISISFGRFPSNNSEKDLVKEVEQLLEPEELAILQQNATPNLAKISTAKWSPIQTLALSGQIRFLDKLLDGGLPVDGLSKDGLTALHKAVIGKKEPVISHLLRKGASPHVRDRDGAYPIHYAVHVGAMQTVKLLVIKYKVDVNVADNDGWTPLHIAVQSRNRDLVKLLLVHGADRTRRNKDGRTPLDLSLCYGKDFKSYDLARLLKQHT